MGHCFADSLREFGLFALPLQDMWGMLLLPYQEFIKTGPGPKGRIERQIETFLNKR